MTAGPGQRRTPLLVTLATGLVAAIAALVLATGGPAAASDGGSGGGQQVRVGTEGTYPPFSFVDPDSGDLTGYDVDVMRAVGEEAGWSTSFVQSSFDALFPALDAGRIDSIANQVTINPEREARYLFTRPYTYSRGVIVTASGTDDITTLDDLRGKVVAASETSNWAQVARDAGAQVQGVEGFAQAAELLTQGRVDALVNDNIAVLDYLASTGSEDIKIAGNAGDDVSRQALVFRQSDAALRDQADQALASLAADGTLADLSEKYFGADVSVENDGDVSVGGSDSNRSTWQVLRDTAGPMLVGALKGTIPLSIISFLVGLVVALGVALARLSPSRWASVPARVYISLIRGTPLLVQLFIVFYGLPQIGVRLPGFTAACLALSLNVGGYAAEIIRASILSVPRGQVEAATTIGMERWQALRRIVLPQALRIAVPPLSNTLLSLVKDTSLVSVVLVTDLFREAQLSAALSTEFMPLYLLAALYYWVICFVLSQAQGRLEHRLERYAA